MIRDESDFQDLVADLLADQPGAVHREVTLPSGRRPDFIVEGALVRVVVEVEYHPEDVVDNVIHGAGQALAYAGELDRHGGGTGAVPVIVANSDALDEDAPEVHAVRSRLPVVALSPEKTA